MIICKRGLGLEYERVLRAKLKALKLVVEVYRETGDTPLLIFTCASGVPESTRAALEKLIDALIEIF